MKASITSSRALLGTLSAAALLAATALPAQAMDKTTEKPATAETRHTVPILNGGIGEQSEHHMRSVARDWPLRMQFSERKADEFVTGVKLNISNAQGKPLLALADAGPMTFAKLPPGKYVITASYKGQTEKREVALDGKSGHSLNFHWKGTMAKDPYNGKPMGGNEVPG